MPTPLFVPGNLMNRGIPSQAGWTDVTSGDPPTGHETYRVADNERDATWWNPGTTGDDAWVGFDTLGADVTVDTVVLDRGHNLAGKTAILQKTSDGATWTDVLSFVMPSAAGGLPTDANGARTPEGVWFKTFDAETARGFRLWMVGVTNWLPIITGLYLTAAYRLPEGEGLEPTSDPEYRRKTSPRATLETLSGAKYKRQMRVWRELGLSITMRREDYADFDAMVANGLLWGDPMWCTHDDSTEGGASMLRLYHLPDAQSYDPIGSGFYAKVVLNLEEVAPRGRND